MISSISANVLRFPPQLRLVSSDLRPVPSALDALLSAGTIDVRQHASALTYGALRRRHDRAVGPFRSWRDRSGLSDEAWQATKREHARMIRAAGAERFMLDRLRLD